MPTPRRDAAVDAAIADGAVADTDSGLSPDCLSLPATGNGLSSTYTPSGSSPDFSPTNVVAAWRPAGCDSATPEIVVSLGDSCDPRTGSRLTFRMERGAIQRGELFIGFPLFVDEAHPYVVRLVLPPTVGAEPSIWGDCTGSVGSITFDDIGETAGSIESASFDITLTDCSSTPALEDVRVTGSFSVTLTNAFEDVCTPAR